MVGNDVIGVKMLFPAREQLNGGWYCNVDLRYLRTTLRDARWREPTAPLTYIRPLQALGPLKPDHGSNPV